MVRKGIFAMIWIIPILVMAGITTGPLLANVRNLKLRRFLGWLVLVAVVTGAHLALTDADAILRMVGICSVLLGGMKGLVYAEWAGEQRLTIVRYGSWLVWFMEWRQIFVMFLPMSLGFHFGALRVLKGCMRMAGFPVRTLFPNVLETTGIGDFWSRRWNVGYSQMMQRLVGRPVEAIAGSNAGVMAIFLASGLLHELAITLPVRSGFGLPTLYFLLHGILTILEKKWGSPLGKIPTLIILVLPLGLLFPPAFQQEVITRCLGVFDVLSGVIAAP